MHIKYATEIVGSKLALKIYPLVFVELVPGVINREEQGEFRSRIKKLDDVGRDDATEIGE